MPFRPLLASLMLVLVVVTLPTATEAVSPDIRFKTVLTGYQRPLAIATPPGPRNVLFIVEQAGLIKRALFKGGTWRKLGVFLDIRDRVTPPSSNDEQGLLGLAFHPDYRKNGRFYVSYTRGPGAPDVESVVSEFRRTGSGRADVGTERTLLTLPQPNALHPIGHLAFGPDRLLYIASGDGGDLADQPVRSRDLDNLYGKIIRIDPVDPDGAGPRRFRVPRSNPYVGRAGRDIIWSSGLRNPWSFSFDRRYGHLWVADVGQGLREEVNRAAPDRFGRAGRGDDYAWDACQGTREFNDDEGDADTDCEQGVLPRYEYAHGERACAVIGGHVLRGPANDGWQGRYVGLDWCGTVFVIDQRGRELLRRPVRKRFVAIGRNTAGRLFAVHRASGTIYRIVTIGT